MCMLPLFEPRAHSQCSTTLERLAFVRWQCPMVVTLCPQVSFLSPTRVSQDWSIGVSEAKIHRAAGMAVTYMPVVDGRRSSTYTFVHFLWHSGPRPNATPPETTPLKGE